MADTTALTGTAAQATNAVAGTNEVHTPLLNVDLWPTIDRAYLTFGMDRIPWLRETHFLGIPLWQYLASFLFIFLAFFFAKVFDTLARVWLKRWAEARKSQVGEMLVDLARGPVKIVVFVIFLHIGLTVFQWPAVVERWLSNALKIVVAVSITYSLLKLVDIAIGTWRQRVETQDGTGLNQQLLPVVRKAVKGVILVVASLLTLDNIGINITALLASLSIGGLALGLAAQDTVANLFGAVAVLIDKPFKVGDRVQFDNVDGVVESIGLRSTRIRNLEGFLVTVPNKTMGNTTITNVSQRPNIRTIMNFGLTYGTTPEKIRLAIGILEEVFKGHRETHDCLVAFNKFGDFSLNVMVVHWWKGTVFKEYLPGMQELLIEVKRRFDKEGIDFAFPTQTVHVRNEGGFSEPVVSR